MSTLSPTKDTAPVSVKSTDVETTYTPMSTADQIREEARIARKWAGEKSDWLNNPYVKKRYEGDPHSLTRRHEEMMTLFRAADRLDHYANILASRAA